MKNINCKKIKNIVFDLGDVLIAFDRKKYLNENISEKKRDLFYKEVLATQEWLMLDRGTLTYEAAKEIFKKRTPKLSDEIDNFFNKDFFEILIPIKNNINLLPKLKEKYNLYVLSNFHKESFEFISKKYEFFKNFDGFAISYEPHLLKPEPEIYEYLLEKFNLNPSETLFIDDTEVNIESAEKMGINGIHLPDYTKLEEKLEDILNR